MTTSIGRMLHGSPRLAPTMVVGALAIAADFAFVGWNRFPESVEGRNAIALTGLALYVCLVQGDLPSLGLKLVPTQGWRYWINAALWIGAAVAALIAVGLGVCSLAGRQLPTHTTPPELVGITLLRMCVYAPLFEETTCRLLVCVPLAGRGRPRSAIVVSGLLFAVLHVHYGNPSPENLVGGLFLAWAYLKSETIVVPILLHSLGNFLVLAIQVGRWYCLHGAS
jgi:uncharacterized protein